MTRDDFNKHCNRCKHGKPCKRRHVYAIELKPTVLQEPKFIEQNPNYAQGKPCVYVGKTSHHPLCRLDMHMNCGRDTWQDSNWTCYCWRSEGINSCTKHTRTARKFISKHMTCYLRKNMYKKWNPQRGPAANDDAELGLAEELRSQGIGVFTDAKAEEE